MNPPSNTSLPSDSAQARHSPQSQRMTTSSHSKTWKGKMAAGVKRIGLPFGKKALDEAASLQMTETVPESSYTYEKPEGSTLMSLEEESSPTEAMKYASQVQHQDQSKESGYDQMPGAMWEAVAAAQIAQTTEQPGQQTSTPSGHGENPSWKEAAQQWKASQGIRWGIPQSQESKALGHQPAPPAGYPGTRQTELDESMGSTLQDVIRRRSLAQVNTFQTLQSNLTPENEPSGQKRNVAPQPEISSLSQTSEHGQIPPGSPQLHESHQSSPPHPSGEPSTLSPRRKTLSLSQSQNPLGPRPHIIPPKKTHGGSSQMQKSYLDSTPTQTHHPGSVGSYSQTPTRKTLSSGGSQEINPAEEPPTYQIPSRTSSIKQVSQTGLTAGAGSVDNYGTWPEPDIMKLDLTQSSNPSSIPNPPSTLNPPLYHKESFSGGSMIGKTSTRSLKNTEGTSHTSGTGTRYGSTEIPIYYDMNPSSTQPTISTNWTRGLEPGYKSTGSPVQENIPMTNPSSVTPMREATSSYRDQVGNPTDEELYKMSWDQFWWHMHDKLPHETYWSSTPQGQAYQQAEPGSQLKRQILSQETQYIAINYWNLLHPDRQLLQGGRYEIPNAEDSESDFSNLGIIQATPAITGPDRKPRLFAGGKQLDQHIRSMGGATTTPTSGKGSGPAPAMPGGGGGGGGGRGGSGPPPPPTAPPTPHNPPADWEIAAGQANPWGDVKPTLIEKPDGFYGKSHDLDQFFDDCDAYFETFSKYFSLNVTHGGGWTNDENIGTPMHAITDTLHGKSSKKKYEDDSKK
ncbi:uncharacterized protein EV420DRAFT_1646002 [Desarmillaria tabescens]|uniref:Uncharacterized protein n=1 Tax=Armillaria tabescens TaxID=1929756 RepID=A0AA39MYY2_ARMTA|nr:uncharacterized protein EV420DRAFT_1646002 [Desarmillaria tabescens]KAK0452041.1 hypothetical protein EV420DRAFT_1646002 [Desarmillaria tabescens]